MAPPGPKSAVEDLPGSGTGWNQLNDIVRDSSGGLWTAGSKQASFGSPTFSLVERSGAAAETDTVTIPVADYVVVKKQLRISATSTNPEATLTAYVTSTDVLIGNANEEIRPLYRPVQIKN